MSEPTERTVLIRVDAPPHDLLVPHREQPQRAVPWCETHKAHFRLGDKGPCMFVQFVLATGYEGEIADCRLEDPPKHWEDV